MGLWSKGLERAQTGEIRLDEIEIPENLLKELAGNIYTVNTNSLVSRYRNVSYLNEKNERPDISRPQIIWWGKFMNRQLDEIDFVITDPTNEIYMVGGSRMSSFEISDYKTNIITERENVKCNFIDTIRNIGRTGGYNVRNLDSKEFNYLKQLVRYMCNFIKPKPYCEKMFYEWLNK